MHGLTINAIIYLQIRILSGLVKLGNPCTWKGYIMLRRENIGRKMQEDIGVATKEHPRELVCGVHP